ncbi:MAG: hypothetical protein JSV51_03465 [Candidatus Bathyarchaeota archaeon]|nr:MAG: hypothetical protein JSV51_03465 [Candidatus Bathyarchaeota archaeon]
MPNIMNINEEDIDSFEKCSNYTVSVMECNRIGVLVARLFADAGFRVIGVNENPHTQKLLKKGRYPSSTKTDRTLERYAKEGIFTASLEGRRAASESDIVAVVAQITINSKKKPNYSLLEKICKEAGMGLKRGSIVLFFNVTGVGMIEDYLSGVLEKASGLSVGKDFGLAISPIEIDSERESGGFSSSFKILGAIDDASLNVAKLILSKIARSKILTVTNIKTAEAANLFQNAQREINQALANEFALLCEKLEIDFLEVIAAANKSAPYYTPLTGIVDDAVRNSVDFLLEEAENQNLDLRLMLLARRINEEIAEHIFSLVKDALKACGKTVRRAKVTVLGISQRPNSKEPPGFLIKSIINLLNKKLRVVQVSDPFFSREELENFGFDGEKFSKAVERTDCIIILVRHSRFGRISLKKTKFLAKKSPAIVDIAQVIDPKKAEKSGFVYRGLGRGMWTK